MKKRLNKVFVLILLCMFFIPTVSNASETPYDSNYPNNAIGTRGNIVNTQVRKRVYYYSNYVDCTFNLSYDDRTGELYSINLSSFLVEPSAFPIYNYSVYISNRKKMDLYTYEVTVTQERTVLGTHEGYETAKVYVTTP